jgi:signal transduction histidine kinase/DNA-binding LacI/PurR family transcriptional regulator
MKRIAFLLDYLYTATFQHEVVNGMIAAIPEEEFEVSFVIGGALIKDFVDPYVEFKNKLYDLISSERFDGIIACTTIQNSITDEETTAFLERFAGLPIVFYGPGPKKYPQVIVDNRQGMYDLVRHFIVNHGYRRVAFVKGPEGNRDSEERFLAYRQVLDENGIPFDPALVYGGSFTLNKGIEAVTTFVDYRKTSFDAIIASNDLIALGVKVALERKGYSIPYDIAIAGFDDSMDASCAIPSLTTVRQSYKEFARTICTLMAGIIRGDNVPKVTSVPAELIIRQSCGCMSSRKSADTRRSTINIDVKNPKKEAIKVLEETFSRAGIDCGVLNLDSFIETIYMEILEGSNGKASETVQQMIVSSTAKTNLVELWLEALGTIRHYFSPLLVSQERIERADTLFHDAYRIVSEIQTIHKNQNLFSSWKQADQLGIVSESVVDSVEEERLRNAIYRSFPIFNIRNFLFAEVSEDGQQTKIARLIVLLQNGEGWKPEKEIFFKASRLYPDFAVDFKRLVRFLLPIMYEEQFMGYVIFERIGWIQPFYTEGTEGTEGTAWGFYCEKIEGLQPLYHSLARDVEKGFYFCRLMSMRKAAEEALKSIAADLEMRNKELTDFAHIASHDLQEPLKKISFFGDRLRKTITGKITEEELDYLSRIQHAASRMSELIEGLLAYSRVTTKRQPVTAVNLRTVVEEVLQDLEIRIRETKGEVTFRDLPVISADPLQMRQLFQNLIGNALKYHGKNTAPIVSIESKTTEGFCDISVSDNGIGFDQKNAEKIFGIFQRLVGKNEYEGTGIGLAICKKIVEQHGGAISAFGEPGKGSRFIIRLPLATRS